MDDEESILAAWLATDLDRAFKQLVLRYQDILYTFALRLSRRAQDAEDIVQEALLGAYITLTRYPPERVHALKLRPWLYKVTLNAFRSSLRGPKFFITPLDLFEEDQLLTIEDDEEKRPDRLFEDAERLKDLEDLVATLPEQYRIVITCFYFEDLTYLEIADLLDQPLGTIKSRLHRGIQLLREKISRQDQQRRTAYGTP